MLSRAKLAIKNKQVENLRQIVTQDPTMVSFLLNDIDIDAPPTNSQYNMYKVLLDAGANYYPWFVTKPAAKGSWDLVRLFLSYPNQLRYPVLMFAAKRDPQADYQNLVKDVIQIAYSQNRVDIAQSITKFLTLNDTLITVRVTGTIAGVNNLYTFYSNGRVVKQDKLGNRETYRIDVNTVLDIVNNPQVQRLGAEYLQGRATDMIYYDINVPNLHKRIYVDGFSVPAILQPLIRLIQF